MPELYPPLSHGASALMSMAWAPREEKAYEVSQRMVATEEKRVPCSSGGVYQAPSGGRMRRGSPPAAAASWHSGAAEGW